MKRAYRARWGRITAVWVGIVGIVWACSLLLAGCDEAYAGEGSPELLPIPVLTIMAEAGGEGLEGMEAVANVIRNRARLRGLTVEEVCLQRLQFSCWNDRGRTVYRYAERNRGLWDDAWTAWQLSGVEDIVNGADMYYNNKICRPYWSSMLINEMQIGSHRFGTLKDKKRN